MFVVVYGAKFTGFFILIGWLLPAIFTTINVVYLHMRPSKHAVQSCWNDLSNEQFSLYIINGNILPLK